jgi:hypothetical protein
MAYRCQLCFFSSTSLSFFLWRGREKLPTHITEGLKLKSAADGAGGFALVAGISRIQDEIKFQSSIAECSVFLPRCRGSIDVQESRKLSTSPFVDVVTQALTF